MDDTACGGGGESLCAAVMSSSLESVEGTVVGSQKLCCPIVFNDKVICSKSELMLLNLHLMSCTYV